MSGYIVPLIVGGVWFGRRIVNVLSRNLPENQEEDQDKTVSQEQRSFVEKKVEELALKAQVTQPHVIYFSKDIHPRAFVAQKLFSSEYTMTIDSDLFGMFAQDEIEFILAHEVSHIKSKDATNRFFVEMLSFIGLSILSKRKFSLSFFQNKKGMDHIASGVASAACQLLIGFWGSQLCTLLFTRHRERRANQVGFSLCSKEGKVGAIRCMKKVIDYHKEYRNRTDGSLLARNFRKLQVTPNGNCLFDIKHPFLTTSLKDLEILASQNEEIGI